MVHSDSSSPTLFLSCFPTLICCPFPSSVVQKLVFKAENYLVQIACATPARVIVRGGNGTHDEPYRLVEIEDRLDPALAWWVDGDGDDENEDAGEGSGEGPAPREESPEV